MSTLISERAARDVVEAATRAPSVLNTQPWRWVVQPPDEGAGAEHGSVLELVADSARVLRLTDPMGRFMVISCGAALLNARLALRAHALEPTVRMLPDTEDPRVLARVTVRPGPEPSADVRELVDAIPRRRTNRGPFQARAIDAATRASLVDAAAAEGALLAALDTAAARRVLEIAEEAAAAIGRDPRRTAEVSQWVGEVGGPTTPETGPWPHLGRDYRPGGPGSSQSASTQHTDEPDPTIAVLLTYGDTRSDWLRAGQALERVLLSATVLGLSASFRNEPLEMLEHRWRIRDATTGHGHPQMVLRLGYGTTTEQTPRRPIDEVLRQGRAR